MKAVTLTKFGVDDATRRFQFKSIGSELWVKTMQAFQERVVTEKLELEDKLAKLKVFVGSLTFELLPAEERYRLVRQRRCMEEYQKVLQERVDAFVE